MDTSEIYIKMCDHPKVQGNRGIPIFGAYELRREKPMYRRDGGVYIGIDMNSTTGRVVWLPRQGQVQEMCPWEQPELVHQWLMKFYLFLTNDIGIDVSIFTTPEQLWLAFYMYEKHKLTWNGEEWKC